MVFLELGLSLPKLFSDCAGPMQGIWGMSAKAFASLLVQLKNVYKQATFCGRRSVILMEILDLKRI